MVKKLGRLFLFVFINFLALGLGSVFMDSGPQTSWYKELNVAPWTPPGFVFGLAWTSIMLLFGVFMGLNYTPKMIPWYALHLIVNIAWNPFFFKWRLVLIALFLFPILLWTLLKLNSFNRSQWYLLFPYYLWLAIATSLNAYIVWYN
jgi:benzodiazapine receptor